LVSLIGVFFYYSNENYEKESTEGILNSLRQMKTIFRNKQILNLTLIYIGILMIPGMTSGFLFYYTNVLKMNPE